MQAGQQNLAVMTFNLRCSTADDGADGWEKRKGFLVETIRHDSPDLLGAQECVVDQFEYLKAQLPDYEIAPVPAAMTGNGRANTLRFSFARIVLKSSTPAPSG